MANIDASLRPVDYKRLHSLYERSTETLTSASIWYIHTVLAQCFLPYRDPKTDVWNRKNGNFSILLLAGYAEDPRDPTGFRCLGLPFGAKPRLFQLYISTKAVKYQSKVVPVERSMTAMMRELGYDTSGGARGTIGSFKEQICRFARCQFTLVGPGPRGSRLYLNTQPIRRFDVWFSPDPQHSTLWPSEIELTEEYYLSLKEHAVPIDFRALRAIQQKPRAQDIYLWMTQRLSRLDAKPLLMRWPDLFEMFGGQGTAKEFKRKFPGDLAAARVAYPEARVETHPEGYVFRASDPPIPKRRLYVVR